jgi:flagellar protein FliS
VTYDPTAAYRSAQVTTSSPANQVVLLYEGAIRFSAQSIQKLRARDFEGAHTASIRAQAIVSALRESLDLSAGEVALQLDAIYDFMLRRLVAGNMAKQPGPTLEVIDLLRSLLEAWRAIAVPGAAATTSTPGAQSTAAVPGGLPGHPTAPRPMVAVPVAGLAGLAGAIRA